ncbi:hypothetical protein [Methylobacterium sp. J-077]|uniref:hypothetical protein n=1 Tax=Methylobacterium sp. J-077 TaxID=2836656 RepID=UPI001FBAC672|nr:hypothetical protein [Methylobacterium sp. J-077]
MRNAQAKDPAGRSGAPAPGLDANPASVSAVGRRVPNDLVGRSPGASMDDPLCQAATPATGYAGRLKGTGLIGGLRKTGDRRTKRAEIKRRHRNPIARLSSMRAQKRLDPAADLPFDPG